MLGPNSWRGFVSYHKWSGILRIRILLSDAFVMINEAPPFWGPNEYGVPISALKSMVTRAPAARLISPPSKRRTLLKRGKKATANSLFRDMGGRRMTHQNN